ncbi:MAG: Type 1 glutamine amidotransferase-like domain-containing protein [Candidatus Dojkabacteria bacterium]
MKLTLFSQNITEKHINKLETYFHKPLAKVKFLYINTPGNYKPYKSEWMIKSERKWQNIFPKFQEFDIERAYRVDKNFDFKTYFESFDFIFISGGNVFVLSYWMEKTGCRDILKKLVEEGKVVYGGESSGAVYVYKDLEIYSAADEPKDAPAVVNDGLGFIDFAPIPHWENEKFQSILEDIKKQFESKNVTTYTIEDNQALFIATDKVQII